jgi:hypothetical protein
VAVKLEKVIFQMSFAGAAVIVTAQVDKPVKRKERAARSGAIAIKI